MAEPLQYIVSSYMVKGETKKAIDLVEAQLKAAPGNPFLLNMLGSLYEVNKDTASAEQYYRKAIESSIPTRPISTSPWPTSTCART